MENLRLFLGTYNVGTSTPEVTLNSLLGLPVDHKSDKIQLPDIYDLSFQEVKAQPQNMLFDALFDDPWTFACRELLEIWNYVKIKSVRLQGLLLNVYCLRKPLLNIREIESEYTRTGLSGMWGNRLIEEFDETPEEIGRIVKNEYKKLFAYDQLRHVMKNGEAFSELTEQDPEFPPTFKFEVGSNKYDHNSRIEGGGDGANLPDPNRANKEHKRGVRLRVEDVLIEMWPQTATAPV
ncbi:hypothetical protein BDFB_005031 [Asbolus verrucosus]|uniref:Inositol polyphosphate-related phosphatase domain-containing protein n=1 Tax=Asbolus verrucosus TaxID=1661398 RepID=A0A482VP02_ASBVE|nr:hypothetical protein BDFB_005031 [Asbolus verrucosus]